MDLSEKNTETIDCKDSPDENSDEPNWDTDNRRRRFWISTILILTTLFLGVIIGGGVMWLTLSRRQMLQKHPEPMSFEKSKSDLSDSIEVDSALSFADSVTMDVDTVCKSTVTKGNTVAVQKTPETFADTLDYKIVGTRASYSIKEGESLVRISLKFYGTKKLWTYIAHYNRELLKDADCVSVGTVIRIPELVPKNTK